MKIQTAQMRTTNAPIQRASEAEFVNKHISLSVTVLKQLMVFSLLLLSCTPSTSPPTLTSPLAVSGPPTFQAMSEWPVVQDLAARLEAEGYPNFDSESSTVAFQEGTYSSDGQRYIRLTASTWQAERPERFIPHPKAATLTEPGRQLEVRVWDQGEQTALADQVLASCGGPAQVHKSCVQSALQSREWVVESDGADNDDLWLWMRATMPGAEIKIEWKSLELGVVEPRSDFAPHRLQVRHGEYIIYVGVELKEEAQRILEILVKP